MYTEAAYLHRAWHSLSCSPRSPGGSAPSVFGWKIWPFSLPTIHRNIKAELFFMTFNTHFSGLPSTNSLLLILKPVTVTPGPQRSFSLLHFSRASARTGATAAGREMASGCGYPTSGHKGTAWLSEAQIITKKVSTKQRYPRVRAQRREERCLSQLSSSPSKPLPQGSLFFLQLRQLNNNGT